MNLPLTNKDGKKLTRRYRGIFPPKTTLDKKAFKAYQDGDTFFFYGKDNKKRPQKYLVPQEFKYV